MTQPVSRAVVEAFYEAFAVRDHARVAEFLADDVEWTISGPVNVLTFCGTRRGKAAVLDLMAHGMSQVLDIVKFESNVSLVDGDRSSRLNRLWARHPNDGRIISYRVAHFSRFQDGKMMEHLSLLDSFDAVEQVLGHSLATDELAPVDDDLVTV
ncbi:MAG: nuclear transport factor 2 family protein [Pseudolabrys sp.]|jgi:ketosteroid isomerase-like protein